MKLSGNEVMRFVLGLRPATRTGLAVLAVSLLLFWQAEKCGESIGKALYYLTH